MFMNTYFSPHQPQPNDSEARRKSAGSPSSAPSALAEALIGPEAAAGLAETFKVLGDLTRVRMLDALSHSELCVGDLAGLLGLTESAVSHQLRLLRSMRLVRSRRAGRMVIYMLDDDHILKLFRQGLDHVEESSGPTGGNDR
ncbi:MAG: ArsR/SmtB family transcription factor [Vicinamibacterales bacterium]